VSAATEKHPCYALSHAQSVVHKDRRSVYIMNWQRSSVELWLTTLATINLIWRNFSKSIIRDKIPVEVTVTHTQIFLPT